MTEYNLTWEEAKEAMKRGAIVSFSGAAEKYKNYRFIEQGHDFKGMGLDSKPRFNDAHYVDIFLFDEWRDTPKQINLLAAAERKWRIVELTDCCIKVTRSFRSIGNYLRCDTHMRIANPFLNAVDQRTQLNQMCIETFTEQLKQDMKPKFLQPIPYVKPNCGEQKMQEPKTYSFEKALSGMRYGKFYRPVTGYKGIYRLNMTATYPVLESMADGQQRWVEVIMSNCDGKVLGGLMNHKYMEAENPEKKEPKFNELGFQCSFLDEPLSTDDNAISIDMTHFDTREHYILQSREKEMKWASALNTFLRLKAHPLVVKPSSDTQYYIIINVHFNNLYIVDSRHKSDKHDFLSPMFHEKEHADKAIEDIGRKNIVEMFKTFSGVYGGDE